MTKHEIGFSFSLSLYFASHLSPSLTVYLSMSLSCFIFVEKYHLVDVMVPMINVWPELWCEQLSNKTISNRTRVRTVRMRNIQ